MLKSFSVPNTFLTSGDIGIALKSVQPRVHDRRDNRPQHARYALELDFGDDGIARPVAGGFLRRDSQMSAPFRPTFDITQHGPHLLRRGLDIKSDANLHHRSLSFCTEANSHIHTAASQTNTKI